MEDRASFVAGPFQMLDIFSLNTIYNIDASQNEKQRRLCRFLNKSQIALP